MRIDRERHEHHQSAPEHWVIADLKGKAEHIRSVTEQRQMGQLHWTRARASQREEGWVTATVDSADPLAADHTAMIRVDVEDAYHLNCVDGRKPPQNLRK